MLGIAAGPVGNGMPEDGAVADHVAHVGCPIQVDGAAVGERTRVHVLYHADIQRDGRVTIRHKNAAPLADCVGTCGVAAKDGIMSDKHAIDVKMRQCITEAPGAGRGAGARAVYVRGMINLYRRKSRQGGSRFRLECSVSFHEYGVEVPAEFHIGARKNGLALDDHVGRIDEFQRTSAGKRYRRVLINFKILVELEVGIDDRAAALDGKRIVHDSLSRAFEFKSSVAENNLGAIQQVQHAPVFYRRRVREEPMSRIRVS